MTRKILFFVLILSLSLTFFAFADQQQWLSEVNALRANKIVTPGMDIVQYCAPCGDAFGQRIEVQTTEVVYTGTEGYYELHVNEEPIDLAYTYIYVADTEEWKNLAMELKLEVFDVPEILDPTLIGENEIGDTEGNEEELCEYAETTAEMLECMEQNFQKSDARLNELYKEIMAMLIPERKEKFKKAQLTWIKYRDACAEFEASAFEGGTMQPVIYTSELNYQTKRRIEDLELTKEGLQF